ncbi:hypothetical protein K4K59_002168 [Colletotrichum sp. SAR11_240]|nr:hypothetical protein K4K59_002168 [Colletotrichum sp. SAR11_240]
MSSRESRTKELGKRLEHLRGSDDASPDQFAKEMVEKKRVGEDNASAQDFDSLEDGKTERDKEQQRTNDSEDGTPEIGNGEESIHAENDGSRQVVSDKSSKVGIRNLKKHRRGDADETNGDREESLSRRKRIERDNELDASPATDNIIQIIKFIRRMALLPDERLMQNLQHGFPLHAQNTILTGFRIIEWFQATESDMEEQ